MSEISEDLIRAQEFQKAGEYFLSMRLYRKFFDENPEHELRFKALFEVADNYFHAKQYKSAKVEYEKFVEYCSKQNNVEECEQGWIDAYVALAHSRIKRINEIL